MNDSNNNPGNTPSKRKWLFPLGVAAIAICSIVVVSCFHDDDPATTLLSGGTDAGDNELPVVDEPPPMVVSGTGLFCDPATITAEADNGVIATYVPLQADNPPDMNISKNPTKHTGQNNLKRLSAVVPGQTPTGSLYDDNGTPDDATDDFLIGDVHPLIVSFTEQVIGGYEGGDGSADIGDPDNVDDMFTALSLDNGKTWKKVAVGETADKWSKEVTWDGVVIEYPGHSHKPTMNIQGNNILVAWNDKYCPSGNPFGLEQLSDGTYPDDYYKVNGGQGSIDYGLDGSTADLLAPNGKELYEVPFSCVWTARGVFGDHDGDGFHEIEWRAAQQLTTGTRDSNKIWIDSVYDAATEKGGFAITWQEDTEGTRAGKGAGPGEGFSGATTNHGTDIWYTYINMVDFDDVCAENDLLCDEAGVIDDPELIAEYATKPKSAVNFEYPVRITNNEICTTEAAGETKPYCMDVEAKNCIDTVSVETGGSSDNAIRCVQEDLDYMTPDATIDEAAAVLDGDTGASRPALKILRTNADEPEFIAILAYEETKGLSEQGTTTTDIDIALEGKAVYFESFPWDQPVEVSAGRVVNLRVPGATVDIDYNVAFTGLEIYENARRVVQIHQVDPCDQLDGTYTFGLIYKQGYSTQGRPSDMYIRMNTGFTYETFENTVTNVSAHDTNDDGSTDWDPTVHLVAQSYDNPIDNTFSPRAFLRGGEIYTGFEYTPNYAQHEQDNVPNNMWVHTYIDSAWQGPMQVSLVTGPKTSTLDPRFIPAPKGNVAGVAAGLESDKSNPNVLFMSYGTLDMSSGIELDLFYTRSTDKGATWEYLDVNGDPVITTAFGADGIPGTADDPHRAAKLSAEDVVAVEEMEVQSLASPDGTMLFNAWIRETEEVCDPSPECGLDSRFGLVDYVDPATIPVPE